MKPSKAIMLKPFVALANTVSQIAAVSTEKTFSQFTRWTILVNRNTGSDAKVTSGDANKLANRIAVLLNYAPRMIAQLEAFAGEGIQITGLEDPCDIIMRMREEMGLTDEENLEDAFRG